MTFLAPYAFSFLALLPVLILFYLLKRKRVVRLVSSTLLWQKFLADHQANAPFQKLRHNWLLILQLLLLLLAILALSRPYLQGHPTSSPLLVLILDGSASMQSTDEAPSRFEKAQSQALAWINGLGDHDQMVILFSGANTEVKQSATGNKSLLRRAVQSCRVTDAPTRLGEALKLAESLTRDIKESEIHLFSDGAVRELDSFENKALQLVFHRVGKGNNNAGIVTLDVRANPENSGERAVYVSLVNFSSNSIPGELELRLDQQLLEVKTLNLGPGDSARHVFLAPQLRDGIFNIRWTGKDDLAADNQASIVSLLPRPVRITLVTRGNRFLQKALATVPNAQLTIVADLGPEPAPADVAVLDDVAPSRWPVSNLLAFHVAHTNWIEVSGNLAAPPIVFWRNTHPLLRYVSFDDVQIRETLGARSPGWAIPVVESQQTPLILAGESKKQRMVWVGFDVLQSNWPLRISFPIFIANAIEWLNGTSTRTQQQMVRAGDAFRMMLDAPVDTAKMILPDQTEKILSVAAGTQEIVFGETANQGVYRLRAGTNDVAFCVNLLDSAESNIQPHNEIALGKYARVGSTALKRANIEIWRWIAGAAITVLLVEWWYFHRRTV